MSWQVMQWAVELPLNTCPPAARAVLMMLAERVDKHGRGAFPSQTSMADSLGVSVRTVERAIRDLRERGLIVDGDPALVAEIPSRFRPNVYDVVCPARMVADHLNGTRPHRHVGRGSKLSTPPTERSGEVIHTPDSAVAADPTTGVAITVREPPSIGTPVDNLTYLTARESKRA